MNATKTRALALGIAWALLPLTGNAEKVENRLAPPPAPDQVQAQIDAITTQLQGGGITPEQIQQFLAEDRQLQSASDTCPTPKVSPRTIQLSVGAGVQAPTINVAPCNVTTITFEDATGAPWPIVQEVGGHEAAISLDRPQGTPNGNTLYSISQALGAKSNAIVMLAGLDTPINLLMRSGAAKADTPVIIRIDRPGPNAVIAPQVRAIAPTISDDMQAFLDNVPPSEAKRINIDNAMDGEIKGWVYQGMVYLRTYRGLTWPAVVSPGGLATSGATRVYKIPHTPFVQISRDGQPVRLTLN